MLKHIFVHLLLVEKYEKNLFNTQDISQTNPFHFVRFY